MAVQWGVECWCSAFSDLDYNRHYPVVGEDAVCDMLCMGDEVCVRASADGTLKTPSMRGGVRNGPVGEDG